MDIGPIAIFIDMSLIYIKTLEKLINWNLTPINLFGMGVAIR